MVRDKVGLTLQAKSMSFYGKSSEIIIRLA